ncbi:hypothetical protein CYY_010401 [Polysphondylium violaceum]|uniref:BRCT domain-containing protein n=1 Tax=Polysphondylium violaceum TaxID=133409 RepID=A0A8J4PJV7_9MYCE|nr:hypothetical protein CYY_010401 [Polysphondylium violaceum]
MSHTGLYGWYWLDDKVWIPYSDSQADIFEQQHQSGVKKIKVDKDRFLDLSLTHAEIVKNFVNVNDPDLIAIQRRYDDHMKRRAVKRVKKVNLNFFDGYVFYYYARQKSNSSVSSPLTNTINTFGGKVTERLTKKVDFMIVRTVDEKDDLLTFNSIIEKAEKSGVTVVRETYISDCVVAKDAIDTSVYIVSQKPVPIPAPIIQQFQQQAAAATTNNNTTTSTPSSSATNTPTKASTTSTTTGNPSLVPNASYLIKDSQWMGVFTTDEKEHYTFVFTVDDVQGDKLEGTMSWPTLNDSLTKYRGTIKGTQFDFEEYEIVRGEDDVEVPNNYTSVVYGDTIQGTAGTSTFKLKLTKSPPVTTMPANSSWSGTSTQISNFKLSVSARKDSDISGVLEFPDHGSSAKFKGTVDTTGILVNDYTESDANTPGPELAVPFKITHSINPSGHNIFTIITCSN